MNILVCIKPDVTGQEIGPFERLALEAALDLGEAGQKNGVSQGCVDVMAAGPESWKDCLVRALGTGADRAFHVPVKAAPDWPGLVPAVQTAHCLARAIQHLSGYDLILTGVMSQDLMAGQTGPMLAQLLNLNCATAVTSLEFRAEGLLAALREMEGGFQEVLDIPLPALVSVQSGHYSPRYPVLSHMLKAREKPMETLACEPAPVVEILTEPVLPAKTRQGRAVQGPVQDQVAALLAFLRERGVA